MTIVGESTGLKQETSSNEGGIYHFSFLLPGFYTVTVEAGGFGAVSSSGVKLDPGQQAHLDFSLVPAGLQQSITVRSSPSLAQAESPAVATEVDSQLIDNLPANGRTLQPLILLAPGVVGFNVNGQRDTANYVTEDGVSLNVAMGNNPFFIGPQGLGAIPLLGVVSLDDTQEFKLQTSTTTPEFGRAAGGLMQIVSRSGSNDFHGRLYDYFSDSALDANNWFSNGVSLPTGSIQQNDFGGTFGGPLLKNRTFFFFSYEGQRWRQPFMRTIEIPTLKLRQVAPEGMQQLVSVFPLPNGPLTGPQGYLALFTGSFSDQTSSDNISIRLDHRLNQKFFLFGRYSEAPTYWSWGNYEITSSLINFHSLTLGATLALSPKATSDLRVNYTRNEAESSARLTSFGGSIPAPDSLLFPAPYASPESSLFFFQLTSTGHFQVGRFADNIQRQANLVTNTSLVVGAHEVRFGADYRYLAPHYGPFDYRQAIYTNVKGVLIGQVRFGGDISTFDPVTLGFHNLSLYGQDNWKVNRRLTLTYGLRWEFNPAPTAKAHLPLSTLTGFPDLAGLQLAPLGTPLYANTYTNFAPRFGMAYQLLQHPGRETTIRGGFGVYYDLGVGNIGDAAASFPNLREELIGQVPYPLSPQDAAPPTPNSLDPPYTGHFNVFGPDHALPRSYQWNVTVDQALGASQALSVSYVGEVGRKLLRQNILFDPNPQFVNSVINLATNASSSDYHALQVQFHRRMSRRLAALLSYTWSHSIDDTSSDTGADGLYDPRIDRGPSDFDVRHAFNAAYSYDIPEPSKNRALRAILGNWSWDGILMASTAMPVNVHHDQDITEGLGAVTARPDLIPGVPLYINDPTVIGGRRINPAAFSIPAENRQGNLARNSLRGFPFTQVDFAIRRQFSITEKFKLQWRTDFFNLFNHPNVVVDGDLGTIDAPNPTFGQAILTMADAGYPVDGPRSIQLSLRLSF